jgi:hypothetical protein
MRSEGERSQRLYKQNLDNVAKWRGRMAVKAEVAGGICGRGFCSAADNFADSPYSPQQAIVVFTIAAEFTPESVQSCGEVHLEAAGISANSLQRRSFFAAAVA